MDKETEKVIKNIAEIQIEALSRIIANEDKPNSVLSQELILKLLEFDESCIPDEIPTDQMQRVFKEVIHEETQKRIDIYKQILIQITDSFTILCRSDSLSLIVRFIIVCFVYLISLLLSVY